MVHCLLLHFPCYFFLSCLCVFELCHAVCVWLREWVLVTMTTSTTTTIITELVQCKGKNAVAFCRFDCVLFCFALFCFSSSFFFKCEKGEKVFVLMIIIAITVCAHFQPMLVWMLKNTPVQKNLWLHLFSLHLNNSPSFTLFLRFTVAAMRSKSHSCQMILNFFFVVCNFLVCFYGNVWRVCVCFHWISAQSKHY